MDAFWPVATLLQSLRIGPLFLIAPPFSQLRVPMRVRVCLALALGASLGALAPSTNVASDQLVAAAGYELLLGMLLAFAFQATFAALSFAGRTLDVQAGYGLATVIDPVTSAQAPLFGTVLTLVAGLLFFASNGHLELIRLLASLQRVLPLGQPLSLSNPMPVIALLSVSSGIALGAVSTVVVTLFLIDLAVAYLSRALPQMNALMLGLQVKTIATLFVVALTCGVAGPVALKLIRLALDFVPTLGAR
jgi:flagellar biosynthetic protein FliR